MNLSNVSKTVNSSNTLVDLLRYRAANQAASDAFVFIEDADDEVSHINYGELECKAQAIGAWLRAFVNEGEKALIVLPPGLKYVTAFFGCLFAGIIAVPTYPPRLHKTDSRLNTIIQDSEAKICITDSKILLSLDQRSETTPDIQGLQMLNIDNIPSNMKKNWKEPHITESTLAFLQYTSGSTTQPRGVKLSHRNLLHNLELIRFGFQASSADRGVFWLPNYHDMGLIGGILAPIYVGGTSILMSPLAFLQRPVRWLNAISKFGGTISGAPCFAYQLCAEKITPEQRKSLDLSTWRLAFCGAEPIRLEVLNNFAKTFRPFGFRSDAFYPCYGLAEASLIVAGGHGPSQLTTYSIKSDPLKDGIISEANSEDAQLTLVGCGQPLGDTDVIIVDPATGSQCQGKVGEIWVSSPSIALGYWNRPFESETTFQAYCSDTSGGPYLRTGDLGFIHDGQLFITGRLKDVMIIRGRNHYPQDIEYTVENSHPALQPSGNAVFSVSIREEERLVVVQELKRHYRKEDTQDIIQAIRQAVTTVHGLQANEIVVVQPLSIPKTSSGKSQRYMCKSQFLEGKLKVIQSWKAQLD